MPKYPKTPLPVFYSINWQYTHRSEWRRLAVPCGRAGSASNMHYDQDILTSATVFVVVYRLCILPVFSRILNN